MHLLCLSRWGLAFGCVGGGCAWRQSLHTLLNPALYGIDDVPGSHRVQLQELLREAELLSRLHHVNIVDILGVARDDDTDTGELKWIVTDLGMDNLATYAERQNARGGISRHDMHRDLKPENVVIFPSPASPASPGRVVAKLIDVGMGKYADASWSLVGAAYYRAPEIGTSRPHTKAVDMFSVGVMVAELVLMCIPPKPVGRGLQVVRPPTFAPGGVHSAYPERFAMMAAAGTCLARRSRRIVMF